LRISRMAIDVVLGQLAARADVRKRRLQALA
jgi:hypothetical protein